MPEICCPACGNVWDTKEKSNRENRYFRGPLQYHFGRALAESGNRGYTKEEIHQIIKKKFFSYKKNGATFTYSTRNKDYTTVEWESIMQLIRDWTWENLNYRIPQPNEPPIEEE